MVQLPSAAEARFWIACADRDHVVQAVKGGFCQLTHGRPDVLHRMSPGDGIVYYSSRGARESRSLCQRFTAIGRISAADVYQVVVDGQFKTFRREVDFCPAREVDIHLLIPSLSFIKNKAYWSLSFRRGYLEVSETDFRRIAELMLEETFS